MKAFKPLYVALVSFSLSLAIPKIYGQDTRMFGTKQGVSTWFVFAPTSQHILTGTAQDRQTFQLAIGYTHSIKQLSNVSFYYEGSVAPVFLERDPTFIGTSKPNQTGAPTITMFSQPYRPIGLSGDFGYVYIGDGQSAAVAGIPGARETTYAFSALPLGLRLSGFKKNWLEPTFSIDVGALYASRNVPVDYTSSFNFLAVVGPGIEIYVTKRRSVRLEFLYQHLSNGGLGAQNPGVDSGAYRLTFTQYR